jgi:hypothetical protein
MKLLFNAYGDFFAAPAHLRAPQRIRPSHGWPHEFGGETDEFEISCC